MAKFKSNVYLGYEDEVINEKYQHLLNYKINKIGGFPDWPSTLNLKFSTRCPICRLHRLLIAQCYAPIENSLYHRTLYLFACINPSCWNENESWACFRSQIKDNSISRSDATAASKLTWCSNADQWDENENTDISNGNFETLNSYQNDKNDSIRNPTAECNGEIESVRQALDNVQLSDKYSAYQSQVCDGAVGFILPVASAELEDFFYPGLVTMDAPKSSTNNIKTLLYQMAVLSPNLQSHLYREQLQFIPKFIRVEKEYNHELDVDEKVLELLNKYNDIETRESTDGNDCGSGEELYEKATPLHGDKLFHAFLNQLRKNPTQILRYSREEPPLLGAPLSNTDINPDSSSVPKLCSRCGSHLICEVQLVPHFGTTLELQSYEDLSHLHFLSVLVFTCYRSCWEPNDTLFKETVLIQPEVV